MSSNGVALPIAERNTPPNWTQTIIFGVFFNVGIIAINTFQFVVSPLYLHSSTRPFFERLIAYTKHCFGILLLCITQLFAPSKVVLSFTDENGTPLDPEQFIVRDERKKDKNGLGQFRRLNFPDRSIWISNHQCYLDWLYLWCLTYFAGSADSIIIILKASLKWVPFVGWGMQFFRFIFLARSWQADRLPLAKHLSFLAERAHTARSIELNKKNDDVDAGAIKASPSRLALLIFPEGTIYSQATRADSLKFSEKLNLEPYTNVVFPRAKGLLFCLRTLAAETDDLWLLDFTIGFGGLPQYGYGERFFTLRSVYMQGIPPPVVHINCTMTKVTTPSSGASGPFAHLGKGDQPPLGQLPPSAKASGTDEWEATESEKNAFDKWLRNRWRTKDAMMERYYKDGDFVGGKFASKLMTKASQLTTSPATASKEGYVELPLRLQSMWEFGDAFAWGGSVLITGTVVLLFGFVRSYLS